LEHAPGNELRATVAGVVPISSGGKACPCPGQGACVLRGG
jgi:hypothetical protein